MSAAATSDEARLNSLREDMLERRQAGPQTIGTVRLDLRLVENLHFEAILHEREGLRYKVDIDEPPARGGTGKGAAPLSHFIAGAAACLLTQYAKLATLQNLELTALKLTARAHFDRKIEGAFRDLILNIFIESPASEQAILELSRESERHCFASNTLRKALKLSSNVYLNGKAILAAT